MRGALLRFAMNPTTRVGGIALLHGLVGLVAVGCHTPTPNDLVVLDLPGSARYALSTEDGIVALGGDDLTGKVPAVQYWKGREIRDDLQIVQHDRDLTLLRPETAKFTLSTFASDDIEPGETLFIQLIQDQDFERLPYVIECHWYRDGEMGDLLAVDTWNVDRERVAARFAGAGVYAKRKGVYEIVGILNGTLATIDSDTFFGSMFGSHIQLLPFMRLDQIAGVLPRDSNFFERGPRAFRPDFEHGLNRDGSENKSANKKPNGALTDKVTGKEKTTTDPPGADAKDDAKPTPPDTEESGANPDSPPDSSKKDGGGS